MRQVTFEKQCEVLERIARAPDGRLFRVRFVIVERDGVLRGRVISCEEIVSLSDVKDGGLWIKDYLYLPHSKTRVSQARTRISAARILSPYTSLDFFMSQMTRAPSGGF